MVVSIGGIDMGKIKLILGASILLLVSVPVNATTVNYDESISGDLPHGVLSEVTNVGTFDIGTNTVSGSINQPFGGGGDSSDSFLFDIDVGHQLNSATLTFIATGLNGMIVQLAKFDDTNTLIYAEKPVVGTPSNILTSASPFGNVLPDTEGTYLVLTPGSFGADDDVDMNYTWAFEVSLASTPVTIDIKPGSDPNSVNPRSNGVIPVAVLGSIDFDATQVDYSTVTFGPDGAAPAHDGHVEDVDDDGYMDAVFHFRTQETGIVCGDTEATLNGEIFDGTLITGTDTVNTVGCKGTSAEKVDDSSSAGAVSWIMLLGLGVLGLWRLNRRAIRSN